jgi:hypothetical protein
LVVRCTVHRKSFTVYPEGFVPFGRTRLVPGDEGWESTYFSAALDAAKGERWSDFGRTGCGWWTTQWRHLRRLGELFGLGSGGTVAELVAEAVGVPLHLALEARATFGAGGFRSRGRALVQILDAMREVGTSVLKRLMRAGYVASWCGRAFYADPRWGLRPMVPF